MRGVPALPPSPVWLAKQVPPKLRRYAWLPAALLAGFVALFLVGLLGADFEWALLAGALAGPVLGYLAVGPPFTRAEVQRLRAKVPRAPPEKRPLLFFPAFLVAAALLYFALGVAMTSTSLDADVLALLSLGVALPAAVGVGYALYGFPHPKQHLPDPRKALQRIPAEKRPLLFVPLGLLVAAPAYFLLGFALTELLDADLAVLLALAGGLAAGFAASARVVGPPRMDALARRLEGLPGLPPRAKPVAFGAFVLLAGSALAVLLGGVLGAYGVVPVEHDLAFPLFLLAGWLLAVPAAGRLFGYPVPQRPLRAYVPRITPEQRPAVLLPLTAGLGLVLMFLVGTLLGLAPGPLSFTLEDAAVSALIAFPAAFLASLRVLGVRRAELDPAGLQRLPERARPVVVLAVWLCLGTLLTALLGQVLTGFVELVAVSYALGLAAALLLVDQPLLEHALHARRARKRLAADIEARLRADMGLAPAPHASGPGRLRRRKRA